MMKKHLVKSLLLLFFALWAPAFQSAHSHVVEPSNFTAANLACPEDPPSNFHVASSTYNSITLKWVENTPGLYYWITGHDNTTNTGLGTVIVTGDEYTWGPLPYPHDFTFTIGASSCVEGPPGVTSTANGKTGIIIVDEIVNYSPCSPQTIGTPGINSFHINVGASQYTNQGVMDNMYTADFYYQSAYCSFALGYDQTENKIYLEKVADSDPRGRFFIACYANNQIGSVFYKISAEYSLEIIRVDQLVADDPTLSAGMRITFMQEITNYHYCGSTSGPSAFNSTNTGHAGNTEQAQGPKKKISFGSKTPFVPPSPNPFAESTQLKYTLDADGPVTIRLFDPMGRMVKQVENIAQQTAGTYDVTVHAEELPDGIYYLHLQTAGEHQVYPIVKRR